MANYCNVPGVEFVYHNDWADPELIYKGRVFNIHDAEDLLWDEFQAQTNNQGTADEYVSFVQANPSLLTDLLDDLISLSNETIAVKELKETAC